MMNDKEDLYVTLGIDKLASEPEIRKAYKRMALQLHPDRHTTEQDKAKAHEDFIKMQNAYEILMDPTKRRLYDLKRASGHESKSSSSRSPFGNQNAGNAHGANGASQQQDKNSGSYYTCRQKNSQNASSSKPTPPGNSHHTYQRHHCGRNSSESCRSPFGNQGTRSSHGNSEWSNDSQQKQRNSHESSRHSPNTRTPPGYSHYTYGGTAGPAFGNQENRSSADWTGSSQQQYSKRQTHQSSNQSSKNDKPHSQPRNSEYTYQKGRRYGESCPSTSRAHFGNQEETESSPRNYNQQQSSNRHGYYTYQKSTNNAGKPQHSPPPCSHRKTSLFSNGGQSNSSQSQDCHFGICLNGEPCLRCIKQQCYCYQHKHQDPTKKTSQSNSSKHPRHADSSTRVFGRNRDGEPCKRCIKKGGYCYQHKDQKKQRRSHQVVYGIRADGHPCLRCIQQQRFCFQHEHQQKL